MCIQTYDHIYPKGIPLVNLANSVNCTSPVLHTVVLDSVEPNTTYSYRVGDGQTMSDTLTFCLLIATGRWCMHALSSPLC